MNKASVIENENIIDMRDYKEKKAEYKKLRKEFKKQKRIRKTAVEHSISIVLILIVVESFMFCLIKPHTGISDFLAHEICMALTAILAVLITKGFSKVKLSERASVKKFDILTVVMLTIAGFSGPELIDNIVCAVCSHFMTVEPNTSAPNTVTNIIAAVVCAPVFEELICRFGFMELTRRHYSAPFVVLFSSLLFSIMHSYNVQGLLNVFTSAVMMGIVYYYTRNIFLTIAEHAAHNALCCIIPDDMKFLGTKVYSYTNGFVASSAAWTVFNTVLFAVSIIIFVKYFVPKYMNKREK